MQRVATLYQTVAIVNSEYMFLVLPAVGSRGPRALTRPRALVWAVGAGSLLARGAALAVGSPVRGARGRGSPTPGPPHSGCRIVQQRSRLSAHLRAEATPTAHTGFATPKP